MKKPELTDKEVETRVKAAIEHTTPDRLSEILASCDSQREGNDMEVKNNKKNKKVFAWVAAAAAMVVVVGVCGLFFGRVATVREPVAAITIDVNPAVRLTVDESRKVTGADAVNEDAKPVLEGVELLNTNLDDALYKTVGSLTERGYLKGLSSAVLVTVEGGDKKSASDMQKHIDAEMDNILKKLSSGAQLMTQVAANYAELAEKAGAAGISVGRAELIEKVRAKNPELLFEDLAKLSVEELRDMCEVSVPLLPIGKEKAAAAALSYAGLADKTDITVRAESELDDEPPRYEVKIYTEWGKFEYEVDAADAKVLSGIPELEKAAAEGRLPMPPADVIGERAAINAALAEAKLKETDVRGILCELDCEDGTWIYEVEFRMGNTEYEYEFDASAGTLLDSEVDADEEEEEEIKEETEEEKREDADEKREEEAEREAEKAAAVSADRAKGIALRKAGFSAADVTKFECEFNLEKDKGYYEVEFEMDGAEYNYLIDSETGEILKSVTDISEPSAEEKEK